VLGLSPFYKNAKVESQRKSAKVIHKKMNFLTFPRLYSPSSLIDFRPSAKLWVWQEVKVVEGESQQLAKVRPNTRPAVTSVTCGSNNNGAELLISSERDFASEKYVIGSEDL
jgi:hypothetical protein